MRILFSHIYFSLTNTDTDKVWGRKIINMKNNIKIKLVLLVGFGLMNILVFQNCSNNMVPMDLDLQSNTGSNSSSIEGIAQTQALSVLSMKCASCHSGNVAMGNINYITDLPSLKYYRLVIPHQAAASPLYTTLLANEDHMSLLKKNELQLIYDWIQKMDTTAGTAPQIIALGPTFKSISVNILASKCVSCHGAGNPSGNLDLSIYSGVLRSVNPNNADGSVLVQRVIRTAGSNGFMPPGNMALTPTEVQALKDWINAGALNN